MKHFLLSAVLVTGIIACSTQQSATASSSQASNTRASSNDTVRIANDSLEYEVLIIDPGFNSWMLTNARPRNHYTQSYLEMHNIPWVNEWNYRARSRASDMYLMEINYRAGIDYGYEVNYMLFNYLTYFQLTNKQRLGGPLPRL